MHSSYLQLGHIKIPIYGVAAALGLMAALGLSQRMALYAKLAPEAVWNAIVAAILALFVFSRVLLIAFNFHSFLEYPLLVLGLPSITVTGIFLTSLFLLGYIRWRRLSLLRVLDAAAPCVAVLWVFLSFARVVDGTRDGMPAHASSGAQVAAGGVYSVELYTSLSASLICLMLLGLMALRTRYTAGLIAGIGLVSSGVAIFFLDFFRLPSEVLASSWLDPSQIIGVAMIFVGAALVWRARTESTRESRNEPPHAI